MKKKTMLLPFLLVLLCMSATAGTVAWLTAKSDSVVNTFTTSNIEITLSETKEEYKMVPGFSIHKDPAVTVEAGSEECYLFVKVETSDHYDSFLEYEIDTADGEWTRLNGERIPDGVYYRKVSEKDMGKKYSVLKEDTVTVRDTVTKAMMEDLNESTYPTLTLTAYASQLYKSAGAEFTALEAWNNVAGE